MRKTILKYESDPKIYDIQSKSAPNNDIVDGLAISECFHESEKYEHISPTLGEYQLVISTEVNNSSEIQSKQYLMELMIFSIMKLRKYFYPLMI